MSNKLDVFKILSDKEKNQEHYAPDFDLLNVKALMEQSAAEKAPAKPAPKPVAKPAPQAPPAKPVQPKPVQPKPAPPEPKVESAKPAIPEKAAVGDTVILEPKAPPQAPPEPVKIPAPPEPDPILVPVKPAPDKPKKLRFLWPAVKAVTLILAVLLFAAFILASPKITVNSMDPMISSGDRVVINKLAKSYKVGDVIVFKSGSGDRCAARIVASGGDVVSLNNVGGLYVNNSLRQEENIHTVTTITDTAVSYPVIVDEGTYFVLGDNRTDSVDSRNYEVGLVDKKDIMGKVVFCFKKIR